MTYYRLAVLGDPVEHSLSPAIHTAALAAAGLGGRYTARTVTPAGMEAAVDEVRVGSLSGASVTMPYKAVAAEFADQRSPEVARSGAANTVVSQAGSVAAFNTDVSGIRRAWAWAQLPADAPSLILGAGGAAAAALLAREGHPLAVTARRPEAATALIEQLGIMAEALPWGRVPPGYVIVNATPLGMHGERLPQGALDGALGLFDMAYGSGTTPAAQLAHERSLPVASGPDMLLGQAIEAFEIWTGATAPEAEMRRAMTTERHRRGH